MTTERHCNIPVVNVDAVTKGYSHVCPFARGSMFRWHCGIMWDRTTGPRGGIKDENVSCPEDSDMRTNRAPSECPFRDGPVIIYQTIAINRERPLDEGRKVAAKP